MSDLIYLGVMAIFGVGFIISLYFTREDRMREISTNQRLDRCLPAEQRSKTFVNKGIYK